SVALGKTIKPLLRKHRKRVMGRGQPGRRRPAATGSRSVRPVFTATRCAGHPANLPSVPKESDPTRDNRKEPFVAEKTPVPGCAARSTRGRADGERVRRGQRTVHGQRR